MEGFHDGRGNFDSRVTGHASNWHRGPEPMIILLYIITKEKLEKRHTFGLQYEWACIVGGNRLLMPKHSYVTVPISTRGVALRRTDFNFHKIHQYRWPY